MIIRSQNKQCLVNLDNIDMIGTHNGEVRCFNGKSDALIGKYSTEEKAVKVLDMIQDEYKKYATIESGFGNIHGAFNLPKCFQMPSDESVEV